MKKTNLLNLAVLLIICAILMTIMYVVNLTLFSTSQYVSPTDVFFVEGIMFIIFGILFLLGSGGINRASLRGAILGATAEAVYGKGGVGPSELFRRDSWRARGFPRIGFLLLLTGFFMLIIYFVSLLFG